MRSTTRSTRMRAPGSATSSSAEASRPDESRAAASPTSLQPTLPGLDSVTSSPASADGVSRFASPESPTMPMSGPAPVRASLSVPRARGAGRATLDIFGQHGSHSSESVALQSSLESRLRAATVSRGSTLFTLTWNDAVTPSGRRICALRASVRRTSGSASTSWPTPVVNDAKGSDYAYSQGNHDSVVLKLGGRHASWATPAAREAGGTPEGFLMRKRKAKAKGAELGESLTSLSMQAQLTSWGAPKKADSERGGRREGNVSGRSNLVDQVQMAPWPTALALDARGPRRGANAQGAMMLGETAQMIRGPKSSGSPASTARRGQLNPDLSRWLMGYPVEWLFAAPSNKPTPRFRKRSTGTTASERSPDSATRSYRSSRPRSSKRRSPRSER